MCPDVEILSSFYDGELEDSQREVVKTHVESCPHCQKKLAELELISNTINAEEEPDFQMAQVNTWNNLMDIIDRASELPARPASYSVYRLPSSSPHVMFIK